MLLAAAAAGSGSDKQWEATSGTQAWRSSNRADRSDRQIDGTLRKQKLLHASSDRSPFLIIHHVDSCVILGSIRFKNIVVFYFLQNFRNVTLRDESIRSTCLYCMMIVGT